MIYLDALHGLNAESTCWVQVTVVKTIGSVPPETGSKMLVTEQGLFWGTVGGGKLEKKALDVALEMLSEKRVSQESNTQLLTWQLQQDVGMTCGGSVTLFFEVFQKQVWPIAIFGAGHVAQALVRTLLPLNAQLDVVDSRLDWLQKLPKNRPMATEEKLQSHHLSTPADWVQSLSLNAFIVVMTMGHATDLPILKALADREKGLGDGKLFPYIGVIGSEAKAIRLKTELYQQGVSQEFAQRLICPIGLPLGNNQPEEIAISIAAQLLQVRDKITADSKACSKETASRVQA